MVFFFFKRKTAYEMRISDWSSGVCSSDLRSLADDRSHDRRTIEGIADLDVRRDAGQHLQIRLVDRTLDEQPRAVDATLPARAHRERDRKSTRLNSSH